MVRRLNVLVGAALLAPYLLGSAACGYEPYTPEPVGRGGMGHCSDPAGEDSGEIVIVAVTPTAPVRLRHYDASCILADVVDLAEVGVPASIESPPGGVWEVVFPDGGATGTVFTVPFGTGGTWSVQVP